METDSTVEKVGTGRVIASGDKNTHTELKYVEASEGGSTHFIYCPNCGQVVRIRDDNRHVLCNEDTHSTYCTVMEHRRLKAYDIKSCPVCGGSTDDPFND